MGRPEEAASLIKAGLSPGDVGAWLGIAPSSVFAYVDRACGSGELRSYDAFLTIPASVRTTVFTAMQRGMTNSRDISIVMKYEGMPATVPDIETVMRYANAAVADVFRDLRDIELEIHGRVRRWLDEQGTRHGGDGWQSFVPEAVRQACEKRALQERLTDPLLCTTLAHLSRITATNWPALSPLVGFAREESKTAGKSAFSRLEKLRNRVMHPPRLEIIREEDRAIVIEWRNRLSNGV